MPEFEETTQFLYQTVQWIFSGIGVTILLEIYGCFKKKRKARKVDWKDKTKYVDDKFYICLLFNTSWSKHSSCF